MLTVALALEVEQVDLTSAKKVEYLRSDGDAIQRVEFASHEPGMEDWRISLQLPKNAKDLNELRTRYDQPNCEESK
ncbi:MAG: hypothetical protein JWL77_4765 [Chthonomonadaceae bacterium]|nr:hypothetical protein [Chthonomonadaceae bacterium]